MPMTRRQMSEAADSVEALRKFLPEGSTVWTIVNSRSKSGISRTIRVISLNEPDGPRYLAYHVSRALGWTLTRKGEDAVRVNGCGMDMGPHLVDTLSRVLYGRGDALKHRWL